MSESDPTIEPGTLLADRYEITAEIGRGGFGTVYKARQLNIDRDVAIKVLPPKFMAVADVAERFRREAQLASRLRHPNTITVHDYGKHDNLLFIVMELLDGEDLADVLARDRTVDLERIVRIGTQILKSLHEAHNQNIIHRDLKPENIFLAEMGGETDFVKVLDFGIAKLALPELGDDADSDERMRKLTVTGSTIGTPAYMSPEQAAGEDVDGRTDLYALGVMLYEMACGRPPFKDDNPVKVMRAHLFEEVPPLRHTELRGTVFEDVLKKALAKDMPDRFADAEAFLEALSQDIAVLRSTSQTNEPRVAGIDPAALRGDVGPRSKDLPFSETAAYQVDEGMDSTPRIRPGTDGMRAERHSEVEDDAPDTIPFGALPEDEERQKVREASALTERSDLRGEAPPQGFESGASSSSSIVTVLEPGPEDEVIVLTTPKDDDAEASPAPSEANPDQPAQTAYGDDAHDTGEAAEASDPPSRRDDGEWSFEGKAPIDELESFRAQDTRSALGWVIVAFLLITTIAAAGYLFYSGTITF